MTADALSANERIVLGILRKAKRPLKAYAILKEAAPLGMTAPMSVYRALKRLAERRLSRRIACIAAYVVTDAPRDGHLPAVFICQECGKFFERPLDERVAAFFQSLPFRADEVSLEVLGACDGACKADE